MTDNWQEKLVEELANDKCEYCEKGYPLSETWPEFHVLPNGGGKKCVANKPGLREAIRRTLEQAEKTIKSMPESSTIYGVDRGNAISALRQLAGKEE